jgi:hypothetical protein
MSKPFNPFSFAYGVLAVVILVCVVGAAKNTSIDGPRYDAGPSMTMDGIGIQIVDHDTNTLYIYERKKKSDVASYKLIEKIDLSLAGKAEILPDVPN